MKYQTKCIKIGVGIRLMKVVDNATTGKSHGFDNGTSGTGNDYTYDANGNMTSDNNKGITSITYNHLNLPQLIVFDNYNSIEYIYNATGQKIKKMVINETTNPVTHKAVDYLDGFQYAGEYLQFFPHGEGYVSVTTAGMSLDGSPNAYYYNYVYNYTDHLGNIRLSYTKDPSTNQLKILEENNYYPFGLKHTVYNSGKMDFKTDPGNGMDPEPGLPPVLENVRTTKYNYAFNNKELQDELNLNVYDYGNRNYMPDLGRFFNVDRFSEKYTPISPYSYTANNPLKYVDVKGDSIMLIIGKPYTDHRGEHPYGHVALRVYNSAEGYDYVYDFGRYGAVRGAFNQTGDGILNVYDNSAAYFKTEQAVRESIGYAEYSTVEEDQAIIAHFNSLIAGGEEYRKGDGFTSYKLKGDYDIFSNNCTTVSCGGLSVIGENWLGKEYDPRDALEFMEANYKKLGLSRTVYKVGGITVTTYDTKDKKKKSSERTMEKKKNDGNPRIGDAGPADPKKNPQYPTSGDIKW